MSDAKRHYGLAGADGSADDRMRAGCCALTAGDDGFAECGNPATHRSQGGKLYCARHAMDRLDLGRKCYPIQEDRPDPRGLRMLLRVVRYQASPSVLVKDFRDRVSKFRDFVVEVGDAVLKASIGVVLLPVGLLWLAVVPVYNLFSNILRAVFKPDEARKAFRILDGLPAKPSPNAKGQP